MSKASTSAVDVSLHESAVFADRGYVLGKRTETGDIVSPPQRASKSLEEDVERARAGRKFLLGGYKTALTLAKVKRESVGEDEILSEELVETVDKFSLFLTKKDFQIDLVMSVETFHITNAERLLK